MEEIFLAELLRPRALAFARWSLPFFSRGCSRQSQSPSRSVDRFSRPVQQI